MFRVITYKSHFKMWRGVTFNMSLLCTKWGHAIHIVITFWNEITMCHCEHIVYEGIHWTKWFTSRTTELFPAMHNYFSRAQNYFPQCTIISRVHKIISRNAQLFLARTKLFLACTKLFLATVPRVFRPPAIKIDQIRKMHGADVSTRILE